MRLSQKTRYGLRALTFLAFYARQRPVQMREVAGKAEIPLRFLEQILNELKRAKLVVAKRGPHGGYQLTRHPSDITLGDVMRVLEASQVAQGRGSDSLAADPIESVLSDLGKRIEESFDAFTIADICRRGEHLGLQRRLAAEGPEYAI